MCASLPAMLGISAEEYAELLSSLFWNIAEGEPPGAVFWKEDSRHLFTTYCTILYTL